MGQFSQYQMMLSRLAVPALRTAAGQAASPQSVKAAAPAALLMLEDDPRRYKALAEGFRILARFGRRHQAGQPLPQFTDSAEHHRPIYYPLVVHLHLAAFSQRYESLPVELWSVCQDALEEMTAPMRLIEEYADAPPPLELTDLALWWALCLYEQARLGQRDTDLEWITAVVHQVTADSVEQGPLHRQDPRESLDGWTYRELAGLHALARLALLSRNRTWANSVERIALFHVQNTQPDHVTNQPWGLTAFLWSPRTRHFAEQQIHDAAAYGSRSEDRELSEGWGVNILAGLLMADAAHALRDVGE